MAGPSVRGAIIVVRTVGGQSPPGLSVPTLFPLGVPLDFRYCAYLAYRAEGLTADRAVKRGLEDLGKAQKTTQENYNFNSTYVLNDIINYPSLYAGVSTLLPDEGVPTTPTNWYSILEQRKAIVDETIAAVGRIEVSNVRWMRNRNEVPQYATGAIAGTGFYVGDNLVMTNRHVAESFTDMTGGKLRFKKDPEWDREAVVWINFSGTYDGEPRLVRVAETVYMAPDQAGESDVALLRLAPKSGADLPKPLRLQVTTPPGETAGRHALVCGYPSWSSYSKPDLERRFQTLKVKRLSLGKTVKNTNPIADDNLRHNCATLEGSSGSPLVDLESGMTWGIHSGGEEKSNVAQPMWKVLANAEVKKLVGATTTGRNALSLRPLDLPEDVVETEQSDRPVVFVCQDDVAADGLQLLGEWLKGPLQNAKRENFRKAAPSVGLITVSPKPKPGGRPGEALPKLSLRRSVCFVIAHGVVITPGFSLDAPVGRVDPSLQVSVEFNHTVCHDQPKSFAITEVIYRSENPPPDVALLRMAQRPDQDFPPPLALEPTRPDQVVDRHPEVFMVGYPEQDLRTPPEVFNRVFPPPYGVKRISLGRTRNVDGADRGMINHDCSTSVGDGGSPLISLTTGRVIGIHLGGSYLGYNFALPIQRVMEIPEVKAVLGPN